MKNAGKCLSLKKKSKSNRAKVKIIEAKVEGNAKSESTVEALKREIREYNESIQYLQSLFEDTPYILLFNEDKKKYSDETFQCIMNLTDLKVPNENVGAVIKDVMKLCGKTPNAVPSAATVKRVVDSKLSVSHKQISDVLKIKKIPHFIRMKHPNLENPYKHMC